MGWPLFLSPLHSTPSLPSTMDSPARLCILFSILPSSCQPPLIVQTWLVSLPLGSLRKVVPTSITALRTPLPLMHIRPSFSTCLVTSLYHQARSPLRAEMVKLCEPWAWHSMWHRGGLNKYLMNVVQAGHNSNCIPTIRKDCRRQRLSGTVS